MQSRPAEDEDPLARLIRTDYSTAEGLCDLVLEGGIAGGVVYPLALCELATRYRFERLGGSSAGALAVSLAAAAEFGRRHGRGEGFVGLAHISAELGRPSPVPAHADQTLLRSLFSTSPQNEPLVELIVELARSRADQAIDGEADASLWSGLLFGQGHWGRRFATASSFPVGAAVGLVTGAGLLGLAGLGVGGLVAPGVGLAAGAALGAFGARLGYIGGGVASAWQRVRSQLTEPGRFGLCSGVHAGHGLFDWLHESLQRLSGLPMNEPLTYGHLGGETGVPKRHEIELRMVATDLSAQRPVLLPFSRDEPSMLLRLDELHAQFPPQVAAHLRQASRPVANSGLEAPRGYAFLPKTRDLPVLLAARASMSFPLMFQALRLYAVRNAALVSDRKRLVETDLEPHLFSDGGLCANLPIHAFDDWYPGRPTFGIMLSDGLAPQGVLDAARDEDLLAANQGDDRRPEVILFDPRHRAARRHVLHWPPARGVRDLESFIGALLDTATSHRDHAHVRLAGFRERVAVVLLDPGEGGFHIDMGPEAIRGLSKRGVKAAQRLDAWWRDAADLHRDGRLCVLAGEVAHAREALTRFRHCDDHTALDAERQAWVEQVETQLDVLSRTLATGALLHRHGGEGPATRPHGLLRVGPDV
ncbi:MAG: hypothetical protein ACOYM9_12135 [Bradymonadia bacterium]